MRVPLKPTPLSLGLSALTCLGASACGGGDSGPPGVAVRDSAGVTIVENLAVEGRVAPWSIDPRPVFRSGWAQGEPEFQSVRDGAVGSDGRLIVADAGANVLYVFSPDAGSWEALGRAGQGPGEFGAIQGIVALGADTFLVADRGNQRGTIYRGVEPVTELRYEPFKADAVFVPIGRVAGDYVLAPRGFALRPDAQPGWDEYPILRSPDLVEADTVTTVAAFENPGSRSSNPVRHFGMSEMSGDHIVHGRTDIPEISWFDLDGRLIRRARWDIEPRSAGEEDWARYEEGIRERQSARDPEEFERDLARLREDFGGLMPLFRWVLGDPAGNVWLSEFDFVDIWPAGYAIVAADGTWLGEIEFPVPIQVLDITESHVLGVERNELDVQAVVLYRIVKAAEG